MTVTFTPADIIEMVKEALADRNLRAESEPKIIVSNESRGDMREQWIEPVFGGISVQVTEEFK